MSESGGGFDWSMGGLPSEDGPREPSPPAGRSHDDPPASLGRFSVVSELGRGGMGVVFLARDDRLGRDVALKVLSQVALTESRRTRFRREGEIAASLDHPGIVKILEGGEQDGQAFLAYELVEGARTLGQAFAGAGLTQKVEWLRDAARALGHAHARGVLHRDVKPDNVLIDRTGRVRVTDFGLAAAQGMERLTQSGALVGTPTHVAPEQFKGDREAMGPPADVWALGVLLYQALTERLPFGGKTIVELAVQIEGQEPVPPRKLDPSLPAEVEAVCLRALAKDPAQRHADGAAFAAELDAWLSAAPASAGWRPARRRTSLPLWALALPVLALLGLGAVWWFGAGGAAPSPRKTVTAPGPKTAQPPALELEEGPSKTWRRTVRLSGKVHASTPGVELLVARHRLRLQSGQPFTVEVPLEWGRNHIVLVLTDDAGAETRRSRLVERHPPEWTTRVPKARRAPFPPPHGVRYTERPGEFLNEKDGSALVWVSPGTFRMGYARGSPPERPVHQVQLTRGYFVGKYEVTLAQYYRFCAQTKRSKPMRAKFSKDDRHPVIYVSWDEARAYCTWAGLRLPSEAEWEYAARGSDGRLFPWGDLPDASRSVGGGPAQRRAGTAPVGSMPRGVSPFGAHDMAGNVFEWVEDGGAKYQPDPLVNRLIDPLPAPSRVIRGGAWGAPLPFLRSTYREFCAAGTWTPFIGFRVARSGE